VLALTGMDAWERHIRKELWYAAAMVKRPWWIPTAEIGPLTWLHVCSGDGHVRERALRVLSGGAPNRFFFALVMRRLNDWVPQVRAAAREQLPGLAMRSDPDDVADVLWATLAHLASWGRMEPADRAVVEVMMSLEPVALRLKARILDASAGPVARILSQAGRFATFDDCLMEIAERAAQPSVRARAYRSQLEARMRWVVGRRQVWTDVKWCKSRYEALFDERPVPVGASFGQVVASAAGDSSPVVRWIAAEFLLTRWVDLGDQALPLAQRLAADRAPHVAARGRFALERLGGRGGALSGPG